MTQLGLLDGSAALARRTDPSTSRKAAAKVAKSGELSAQRLKTLEKLVAMTDHGGEPPTSAEMGAGNQVDRYLYARRLPDLARAVPPLVERLPSRVCGLTKNPATTWSPTAAGREAVRRARGRS
jgi:hypothetical protein